MEGLVLLILLGALYFAPSVIAAMREHRQTLPIFVLNLFLGWTVIGWVGALVWAFLAGQESGGSVPYVASLAVAAENRSCPHCAESIKRAANVCRFCGRDVEPAPPAANPYVGLPTYSAPAARTKQRPLSF